MATRVKVLLALTMPVLAVVPFLLGWLVMLSGSVWFIVLAFQEDVTEGLLVVCVPFYWLYYLVNYFDHVRKAFFLMLIGWLMILVNVAVNGSPLRGWGPGWRGETRPRAAEVALVRRCSSLR